MKKLLAIIIVLISLSASGQVVYTPLGAAGYQIKYLRADSGFSLPVRDTVIGRGVNKPGLMVISPKDSLPYYYNGTIWKPIYIDSAGVIKLVTGKVDSVTVSGNNVFYWQGGVSHGQLLNKLDSIHRSGDSVFTCIAGNCIFQMRADSVNISTDSLFTTSTNDSVPSTRAVKLALNLKVDSVTTSSDSTKLIYWKNGASYIFYSTTTGLTGGDTTVFQTVVDTTGQPGQRVLWSGNNKIHSDQYFLYDSSRHKLVIGNKNISVGGTSTKFYVVGNSIINGSLTASSLIKQGGTSSQFLKADGSVDASTYQKTTDSVNVSLLNGGKIDTSHIPIQNMVIQNQGAGIQLIYGSGSDTLHSKNIQAGANITLTKNSDSSVTVSSSGGGSSTVIDSTAQTGILKGDGHHITAAVSGTDIKTINGTSILGSGNLAVTSSTNINDSLAKGFKISDSVLTGQTLTPPQLTWNKVSQQRYFKLIDENFINYQSNFSASEISEFTTAQGTAATIDSNSLSIKGNTILKSQTNPVAPFTSVEMNIRTMVSAGTYNKIGVGLIKDSSNYVVGLYDQTNKVAKIVVNGTVLDSTNITLDSANVLLTLVVTGNGISLWATTNGDNLFLGNATCSFDLQADGVIQNYKYGIFSSQDVATATSISSLRGGASGGGGLINVRQVVNEDNSPYIYANKLLITADWTAATGSKAGRNYAQVNSCVFAVDMNTYQIETVGRLYFRRDAPAFPGVIRVVGGQNTKLMWVASKKKWLLIYAPDWDFDNVTTVTENDQYAWLDYEAPFGQTIIQKSQLNKLGIDTVANTHLIYDVDPRYINGTWYLAGAETNSARGSSWTNSNPILLSGSSLDSLTATPIRFFSSNFYECGTWGKVGNKWYINYFSYGDTKSITLNFPTFDSLGMLNLPFAASQGINGIPGYEYVTRQKNGQTEYLLMGFDTKNAVIPIGYSGTPTEYPWSRGNFVVFKANETSTGYEFPNNIPTQISFPIKNIRLGQRRIPSGIVLTTGNQTITGVKYFMPGYSSSSASSKIQDLVFQNYALNNNDIFDNGYYNGSSYTRINTGYFSGIQFYNGQVLLNGANTGTGAFTPNISLKADYNGNVAIGGNIATALGNYGGSSLLVTGTGASLFGTAVNNGLDKVQINGSALISGYKATNYMLRVGDMAFQPSGLNNSFIMDNSYFNGSGWTRINTGYTVGFQLYNGQALLQGANTGTGAFTPQIFFKGDYTGTIALGGTGISATNGSYTGATLVANSTGVSIGLNGTSPNSALQTTSFASGYVAKSVAYTATISDHTIEVTATGQIITLPTAVGITGREYVIKLTASGTATVATTSSQTIDGATTYSLSAQYKYVTVQSNGTNWIVIGNN